MTGKLLFISDFDGTLTDSDFFHVVIDRHFPDEAEQLYAEWDAKTRTDLSFLTDLFARIGEDEQGIERDIERVPFDEDAAAVIRLVHELGGDFVILSAGSDYYIKSILKARGIEGVRVYSNPGVYADHGIQLSPYPDPRYTSPVYGIDKAKLTKDLIQGYDTVLFAGDSLPDLKAAMLADTTFAKGKLQALLDEAEHPYIPITGFADVERYLTAETELLHHAE